MKPLLDPLLDVEQNADEPKLEFAGSVDGVDRVGGVSSRWKPTPDMVAVFILGACLAVSALLVLILALYCLMQCWRQRAHSSSHKCITKYSGSVNFLRSFNASLCCSSFHESVYRQ